MNMFNKLRLIKHSCELHKYGCTNCPHNIEGTTFNNCKIKEIIWKLQKLPSEWDIDEIERLWNA